MEFTCKTVYDHRALAAMSRALRKTLRKRIDCGLKVFAGVVTVIALITILDPTQSLWVRGLYGILVFLMLFVQWKGDSLNAIFAKRKALPGTEVCRARFVPDHYETVTAGAATQWQYDRVLALVETSRYFIFILGRNHAQAFEKRCLERGSEAEFRTFLEQKTGKNVQYIGR